MSLDNIGLNLAQGNYLVNGLLLPLRVASILLLILVIGDGTKLIQRKCCLGQIIERLHLLRELGRIKLYTILLKEMVLHI